MATIKFNGTEYKLATNLRVAYIIQGQHNHKSYTTIFSELDKMTLEDQINVLYAAFSVANPEKAKEVTADMFRVYLLDAEDFTASTLINLLQEVIAGILGQDLVAPSGATNASEEDAKN